MDKKAKGQGMMWFMVLGVIAILGAITWAVFLKTPQEAVKPSGVTTPTGQVVSTCSGVQSVNALYNDYNRFSASTDPAQNLTIYDPIPKVVADDATSTTVPVLTSFKALAGDTSGVPSGTYFAEEVSFDSVCSDINDPLTGLYLSPVGAPTLTLTNDNGVTQNANTAREAVGADSTYSPTLRIKAPSNYCSAKYGGVIVAHYDGTYTASIDSPDVPVYAGLEKRTAWNSENATADQKDAFFVAGDLCDGDHIDVSFDITTDPSTGGDTGQGNVRFEWIGLQKDLDTDTARKLLDVNQYGMYDDKSNFIGLGNTSVEYFTS